MSVNYRPEKPDFLQMTDEAERVAQKIFAKIDSEKAEEEETAD